ncbi:3 beta-hydroxysteroid dehydrogenase type 7-like [Gastrophryne carolinensis]
MAQELVYLVTGGSGYIGERIVELLLTTEYVKEVKIFDINESDAINRFNAGNSLGVTNAPHVLEFLSSTLKSRNTSELLVGMGIKSEKLMVCPPLSPDINPTENLWGIIKQEINKRIPTITFIKGDITNYNQVLEAFKGVHVVIHTAALVDYLDENPFEKLKSINVGGTENVVNACLASGVPYLLYTSSISAVGPNTNGDPMNRITEETIYHGELLLSYGKTKAWAEKLVLSANGQQMSNGGKLVTCAIRPCTVYGEKTQRLLTSFRSAKLENNQINYIETEDVEQNCTYVGNVAWMHVVAARQMQLKPELLGGQAYYTYDDTPYKHRVKLLHDLFSEIDSNITFGAHIPYWKMWLTVAIHGLIRFMLKPFWNLKPFLTLPILKLINVTFCPETDKASRHFGYVPFYSWVESKHKTSQWLKIKWEESERTIKR